MNVDYSTLPEHMREGTRLYIEEGIEPGGFLTAVLENNFVNAFGLADHINVEHLKAWATWLYMDCPANAWGSKAKVDAWITKKARERVFRNN